MSDEQTEHRNKFKKKQKNGTEEHKPESIFRYRFRLVSIIYRLPYNSDLLCGWLVQVQAQARDI